jgi:hypothetical protein
MKYRYTFNRTGKELSATVQAEEPLAHMEIGNRAIELTMSIGLSNASVYSIEVSIKPA